MPLSDQHEKEKVFAALDLIRQNKRIKVAEVAQITRVSYICALRRLKEVSRLTSQRDHNKKIDIPFNKKLKEYLFMCHPLKELISTTVLKLQALSSSAKVQAHLPFDDRPRID